MLGAGAPPVVSGPDNNGAMNVRLREATPEDHDFLRELNRRAYFDLVTRQFGSWDDAAQEERFDAKLDRASFRIAEVDGRAVGAIWSSDQDDHILLHELLVLPEFQNQGIGSEILESELDRARTAGKPVRMHTLVLSRARAFYKRHGFKETGRTGVYVSMEIRG